MKNSKPPYKALTDHEIRSVISLLKGSKKTKRRDILQSLHLQEVMQIRQYLRRTMKKSKDSSAMERIVFAELTERIYGVQSFADLDTRLLEGIAQKINQMHPKPLREEILKSFRENVQDQFQEYALQDDV